MRNFVIALLLLCLITGFGCNSVETGRSSAGHIPTPAAGQQSKTSSTPLKENSNQQGKTAPATSTPPVATNKITESLSSPSSSSAAQKKSNCDPNYSGCVPIASDVDCASGKGDGPEYVDGPIQVIGDDIYKLDKDGDGTACEN